jgi:DNA mismatch repair protein MutL
MEIAGGKILRVDDAALPAEPPSPSPIFSSTRRRGANFSAPNQTELAHVTALVTHYALAHPEKHFELVSATHTIVSAPPVATHRRAHLPDLRQRDAGQLLPVAAEIAAASAPACPSRRRGRKIPTSAPRDPGTCGSPASSPSPSCKS